MTSSLKRIPFVECASFCHGRMGTPHQPEAKKKPAHYGIISAGTDKENTMDKIYVYKSGKKSTDLCTSKHDDLGRLELEADIDDARKFMDAVPYFAVDNFTIVSPERIHIEYDESSPFGLIFRHMLLAMPIDMPYVIRRF